MGLRSVDQSKESSNLSKTPTHDATIITTLSQAILLESTNHPPVTPDVKQSSKSARNSEENLVTDPFMNNTIDHQLKQLQLTQSHSHSSDALTNSTSPAVTSPAPSSAVLSPSIVSPRRDKSNSSLLSINNNSSGNLAKEVIKQGVREICSMLEQYNCYSIIPDSGKIVVLDTGLDVKAAFHALEENNIKSAPLWDSTIQDYVGIITVSDFIEILLHFYKLPNVKIFEELEKHQIRTWREIIATSADRPGKRSTLIYIDPDETLYEASHTLLKYRIHRLPIIDRADSNSSILHIITHYRILSFLMDRVCILFSSLITPLVKWKAETSYI